MTQTRSRLLVGSGLAALVICAAAGGAGAVGLIGSKDIADDSIRSVDIKNGTIVGKDVRDGSLTAKDVAGGLSKVRVATWAGTYTADGGTGGNTPLVVSHDSVPANSLVNALAITVDSDFSACPSNFLAWVQRPTSGTATSDEILADLNWHAFGYDPAFQKDLQSIVIPASGSEPLELHAACADQSGDITVPSFTYKVRFSVTPLATPGALTFS